MGIQLRHPATGRTITVRDARQAAVHARSGWVTTGAEVLDPVADDHHRTSPDGDDLATDDATDDDTQET